MPSTEKTWEERFENEIWPAVKGTVMAENMKDFIRKLLTQARVSTAKEIKEEISHWKNVGRDKAMRICDEIIREAK